MNELYDIDWGFIKLLEGFTLKGYVPKDRDIHDKVQSGVTVISGFDLGQQSETSMRELNLEKELHNKLDLYVGHKGESAKTILALKPLTLTEEEGSTLEAAVHTKYVEATAEEYDNSSDMTFCMLDKAKQTVIVSVAFQYGSLKHRCPTFFKLVTGGLWNSAVDELRDFGDNYTNRRHAEAHLLESSIPKKERLT